MEDIKNITAFSGDAIGQCMARVFTPEEREQYLKLSKILSEGLGEHKKLVVKRKPNPEKIVIPKAKEIFQNKIMPQIVKKLDEYDEKGKLPRLTMKLSNLMTDYTKLSWDELLGAHQAILKDESNVSTINLIVKLNRGLLYMVFYKQALDENPSELKQWFKDKIEISYDTAMRYITFACLIRRFPRLLICQLSFDQVLKHRQDLTKYLSGNDELADRLSIAVEFDYLTASSTKRLRIEPSEMDIPALEYNLDPDACYYSLDHDEDAEFSKFIQGSGDLRRLMFPEDSSSTMEEEIVRTLASTHISPNVSLQSKRSIQMSGYGRGSGLPALPPPPPQQFK